MRLRLLTKMLLFILAPALLGLSLVAALSYRSSESALSAQIAEEMTLVIERQKSELANMLAMLFNQLDNSSRAARVQAALQPDGGDEKPAALRQRALEALEDMKRSYPLMSEVGLLDAQGTVIAHTVTKSIGTSRSDRDYFQHSMQGKRGVQTVYSKSSGKLTVVLSVPVEDKHGVQGVLFANLDIAGLGQHTTDTIHMGRTGICYVYGASGLMLIHPNKDYLGDEDGNTPWVRAMLAEGNGRVAYEWEGSQKVAYFRHIPQVDWYVVLSVERDDMLTPVRAMLFDIGLAALVGAALVGLIIFVVARGIAACLRSDSQLVSHVAAGNLHLDDRQEQALQRAGRRSDEIGELSRGIGAMVTNIRRLFDEARQKTEEAEQAMQSARQATEQAEQARHAAENARREGMLSAAGQLEDVVGIVSSASTELSTRIEQSDRGAADAAARLAEAAAAMNEMNATVLEVAKNAGVAADASTATKNEAEQGAQVVEQAVNSIRAVQTQTMSLKDDMEKLDESARAISRIMGVISDIADQTNLLALNAAIEAARAGDAGRGFAVVADEVRSLAEKTMASTKDVGEAIRAIQGSVAASTAGMDRAVRMVDEASDLATRSGQALQSIVDKVDDTVDQVRAIAAASEEQSAASEEINASIAQVNDMVGQTAEAMREAARAVADLADQARNLDGLIEDMKNA